MYQRIILLLIAAILFLPACSGDEAGTPANNIPEATVDAGEELAYQLLPFLSPKYQPIGMAVVGLAAGMLRARYNREAGKRIVRAIDQVKLKANGIVNFNSDHVKKDLDVLMKRSGKRLVDEAQRKAA